MKISVVITVKNDSSALWHTFNSIFTQLTKYEDFDIIIIDDNSDSFALQEYFNRPNFDKRVKYHRVSFDTTATSRGYGINMANGELVLCLDSHVILSENGVDKIIQFFNNYKTATIGFIPLIRYPGFKKVSHHAVHWNTDWWFDWLEPKNEPFKCASGGHGAFVIKKTIWNKIGGYCGEFSGYGGSGEEIYINILNWMYGGENWVITDLYQIHNDWGRNYKQNLRQIQCNFIITSYLLGDRKYSDNVKNSYVSDMPKELYEQFLNILSDKRKEIYNIGISLDSLLKKFKEENIDY